MTEQGIRIDRRPRQSGAANTPAPATTPASGSSTSSRARRALLPRRAEVPGEVCRISSATATSGFLALDLHETARATPVALALYYKKSRLIRSSSFTTSFDLPPGCMKIKQAAVTPSYRPRGDTSAKLSTPNFWRLRFGTGHPRTLGMAQQVADFVLPAPSSEHEAVIEDCIGIALSRRLCLLQKAITGVSPPSCQVRQSAQAPKLPPNEAAREPLPVRRAPADTTVQGEDGPVPARRRHRDDC